MLVLNFEVLGGLGCFSVVEVNLFRTFLGGNSFFFPVKEVVKMFCNPYCISCSSTRGVAPFRLLKKSKSYSSFQSQFEEIFDVEVNPSHTFMGS